MVKYRKSGSLLEIGCSNGQFLNEARKFGYKVYGIEPHQENCQYARNILGLEVFTGTLSEAELKDKSFDIVVMLHIIEHLPDPSKEVSEIRKKLVSKGLLVIETPKIDNVWYRVLRKKWRQFIPGHYFFFSESTIRKLLEKHGFRVLTIRSIGKTVSLRFLFNRLERLFGSLASFLSKVVKFLKLDNKLIYINAGDVMIIFAEKTD